jgi:nicotinamidase-related amidase
MAALERRDEDGATTPPLVRMHSLSETSAPRVALLLVDYQPAYWAGPAALAFPELPARVGALLARARSRLAPPQIVHVRANYSHRFAQNFKRLNPGRALPGDVEATPWAASTVGEKVVVKGSFDAFHDTRLDDHLRALGCDRVVVCGLLTSACVLFTAQSAFARGYRVTLFEPACGDKDVEIHAATVRVYGDYLFEVAPTDAALAPLLGP